MRRGRNRRTLGWTGDGGARRQGEVDNVQKVIEIKSQLHKGEDLGYSTDCQPGVVLYKKVELANLFVFAFIV